MTTLSCGNPCYRSIGTTPRLRKVTPVVELAAFDQGADVQMETAHLRSQRVDTVGPNLDET